MSGCRIDSVLALLGVRHLLICCLVALAFVTGGCLHQLPPQWPAEGEGAGGEGEGEEEGRTEGEGEEGEGEGLCEELSDQIACATRPDCIWQPIGCFRECEELPGYHDPCAPCLAGVCLTRSPRPCEELGPDECDARPDCIYVPTPAPCDCASGDSASGAPYYPCDCTDEEAKRPAGGCFPVTLPDECAARTPEQCRQDGHCQLQEVMNCQDSGGVPAGSGEAMPDRMNCELVQQCIPLEPLPVDCSLRSVDRCTEDGRCLLLELDSDCRDRSPELPDDGAAYPGQYNCSPRFQCIAAELPGECWQRPLERCAEDGRCQLTEDQLCPEDDGEAMWQPCETIWECQPLEELPERCADRPLDRCGEDGRCEVVEELAPDCELPSGGDSGSGDYAPCPTLRICTEVMLPRECGVRASERCIEDGRCQLAYLGEGCPQPADSAMFRIPDAEPLCELVCIPVELPDCLARTTEQCGLDERCELRDVEYCWFEGEDQFCETVRSCVAREPAGICDAHQDCAERERCDQGRCVPLPAVLRVYYEITQCADPWHGMCVLERDSANVCIHRFLETQYGVNVIELQALFPGAPEQEVPMDPCCACAAGPVLIISTDAAGAERLLSRLVGAQLF